MDQARDLVKDLLELDGHRVTAAASGIEAAVVFSQQRFDVVITDRSMPAMSGDEVAIHVKESAPSVPVIMITGFGVLMTSAGERPAGVDVVLPKPVTRAALRDALRMVCPAVGATA
jgi:CheY-like chemotaxis protein